MSNKLTEQELTDFRGHTSRLGTIEQRISQLEIEKARLLQNYPTFETEYINFQNAIAEKYGDIKVDIKTGEFTVKEKETEDAN